MEFFKIGRDIPFMRYARLFNIISVVTFLLAVVFLFTRGLHLSVEFIGGTLMGFGGVTAMGCTIGQGITGFSTLSVGSIITFFAIIAGAAATMKYEYWRMMREA